MLRMAKRKPGKPASQREGQDRPASSRSGKTLFVYLDPAIRDALDALVEREDRSLTKEVERALKAHLEKHGLWPPKEKVAP